MKLFIIVTMLCLSTVVEAKIYKCKKDGKTIYKESPCDDDEKKSTFDNREIQQNINTHKRLIKNNPAVKTPNIRQSSTVKTDVRLREIELDIKKTNSNIDSNQELMEVELEQLQKDMAYSSRNVAGQTRNKQLATQMNATVSKFNGLIDADQRKMDRLIREQQRLRSKKVESSSNETAESANIKLFVAATKKKVRITEIEALIKSKKRDLIEFQEMQEDELDEVRKRMDSSSNNWAGATRDEHLAMQMEVVVAKYRTKINILQKNVDRLLEEKFNLLD